MIGPILMIAAALLALVLANTPAYAAIEAVLGWSPLAPAIPMTLESFVNDGLMAVFFLQVGIELKHEMRFGQLRNPRQAALPMLAAAGGVCGPALIYLAINWGQATASGWAVPIATDIAFALGVASLSGERIRPATKVFFQTLAIADDILAIVALALFYGQSLDLAWCAASVALAIALWGLNRAHVRSLIPYTVLGVALWACMLGSGVHATLAGVIVGFSLPSGAHGDFAQGAPLERMGEKIDSFVTYVVLPVFAFANAALPLAGVDLAILASSPVALGAYVGAVLGKPIGICTVTFLLVKVGFAKLPEGMDARQVVAVGLMGGVGFTMSILVAGLAFSAEADVTAAKCAVLLGSVTAAVLGTAYARVAVRNEVAS